MKLRLLAALFLTASCGWTQVPSGRWDGSIVFGDLKVPFTIQFESTGTGLTGSFVNGEARAASTSGNFTDGKLHLQFEASGTRMEASLADGTLKGTYGSAKQGFSPFTASAYCTCSYEGEAGPDIMGSWEVPDAGWRLDVRRKGEDTFATLSRSGTDLGPLTGRFDGAAFMLHYFDGTRAAMLEIEPRKDGALDLTWQEPGQAVRKHKARRS